MNTLDGSRLSIVVLTYNRHRLLNDCLQSLVKQKIGGGRIELVVSDDGSTDDTQQVVFEFKRKWPELVYVRQPHKGIPAARNLGIQNASGDFIAIVADDYILTPDYAETVLRFFENYPQASIVRFKIVASRDDIFSRISQFYYEFSFSNRLLTRTDPKTKLEHLKSYFQKIPTPKAEITSEHDLEAAGAAAFRRSVFDRAGLFDETLLRGEDTDYTRRLRLLGIPVYYNPFHEVRHQYAWGCLDTIRKNFLHGVNHYQLYRKYAQGVSASEQLGDTVRELLKQSFRTIWRARQIDRIGEVLLFFPALVVFELAVKTGMCWGFLTTFRIHKPSTPKPKRPG
jgi:GT2 family glycosyltransferase